MNPKRFTLLAFINDLHTSRIWKDMAIAMGTLLAYCYIPLLTSLRDCITVFMTTAYQPSQLTSRTIGKICGLSYLGLYPILASQLPWSDS